MEKLSSGGQDEEAEEAVLYEDKANDSEERIENSQSDIEHISDEEYLIECARYNDLEELLQLFKDNLEIDINYKDFRGNTAVRK